MKLSFKKNNPIYFEFIRNLRNHPIIKQGFLNQAYISKAAHSDYMHSYANSYYICLFDERPVGYIGIVKNDLRLAVQIEYQSKGVATFMLKKIMEISTDFDVLIKSDNIKSINFFSKHAFVRRGSIVKDGVKLIRMQNDQKVD